MTPTFRTPVAISAAVAEDALECVYVVCDDGTVWSLSFTDTRAKWNRCAEIPGTEAAPEPKLPRL